MLNVRTYGEGTTRLLRYVAVIVLFVVIAVLAFVYEVSPPFFSTRADTKCARQTKTSAWMLFLSKGFVSAAGAALECGRY